MSDLLALSFPLSAGLFIILGCSIVYCLKNSDKFVQFSISMAFGVMIALISLELFPESTELLFDSFQQPFSYLILVGSILLGIFLLRILDLFIPDHEIEEETEIAKKENLYHIGLVASVALVLHNIIEGMAIYSTAVQSQSLAFVVTIGVGLHNIPMGMVIASTLKKSGSSRKKTIPFLLAITLSTFIGGILMYFLRDLIGDALLGILLAVTLGMLLYIVVFELFGELLHAKEKKLTILGIIFGIIIFMASLFFE